MSVAYGPTQQQPQQAAQQHPPPMPPNQQQRIMPPNSRGPAGMPPPPPLSTAHIQKILDDNCGLIQTIQDFQNLGKLNECASYSQALHRNLVYLTQMADGTKNIAEILPPPHVLQGLPPGASGYIGGSGVTSPSQIPPSHHPNETGTFLPHTFCKMLNLIFIRFF